MNSFLTKRYITKQILNTFLIIVGCRQDLDMRERNCDRMEW